MANHLPDLIGAASRKLHACPIEGSLTVANALDAAIPQVDAVSTLLCMIEQMVNRSEEVSEGVLAKEEDWQAMINALSMVVGLKAFDRMTQKVMVLPNFVHFGHRGHPPSELVPTNMGAAPAEWAHIVEIAQEQLAADSKKVKQLQEELDRATKRADDNNERCSRITRGYEGMRTKLDMAFGAPDDGDPGERRAKGRSAGLEGAVDFAIAKHAEVTRKLGEQNG